MDKKDLNRENREEKVERGDDIMERNDINVNEEKKGLIRDLIIVALCFGAMVLLCYGIGVSLSFTTVLSLFAVSLIFYIPFQIRHYMNFGVLMTVIITVVYVFVAGWIMEKFVWTAALFMAWPLFMIGRHIYRIYKGSKGGVKR